MGEAPRARITAQNTLTTWHADRLYGAMVIYITLFSSPFSMNSAIVCWLEAWWHADMFKMAQPRFLCGLHLKDFIEIMPS